MSMKRVILKLSGEALGHESRAGICPEKVNKIALEIKQLYDQNDVQIAIVVGAGNIWRGKDAESAGMERSSADYMGMIATILNALALQSAIEKLGIETRTMTSLEIPAVAEPYIRRKASAHLDKNRLVIFGGGNGIPFFTTDTTAALRSAELGAELILMAKNGVDGVYDSDPRINKDAKKYNVLTHQELLDKHLNVMDLTAATLCSENDIDILVFDMNVPGNFARAVHDYSIGTLITNKKKKEKYNA
ncbi:MAG: UMP kinase [Bacilli bacterium]|nr:UMP kinase [Bacilli bacterium]MDD2682029.1 UMP kinase [Bacilli bacterium]MDD3121305.1 UMP kinase [Bacilli bacterium]MDD4063444.1 UMP kinase [Bacilli bacterium]MDD4482105.1 UMP kinase [Bacilli bacterium]